MFEHRGQKTAKQWSTTWGGGELDQVGSNFFPDEDNEGTIIYVIWFFLEGGEDNNNYVSKKCTIFNARGRRWETIKVTTLLTKYM